MACAGSGVLSSIVERLAEAAVVKKEGDTAHTTSGWALPARSEALTPGWSTPPSAKARRPGTAPAWRDDEGYSDATPSPSLSPSPKAPWADLQDSPSPVNVSERIVGPLPPSPPPLSTIVSPPPPPARPAAALRTPALPMAFAAPDASRTEGNLPGDLPPLLPMDREDPQPMAAARASKLSPDAPPFAPEDACHSQALYHHTLMLYDDSLAREAALCHMFRITLAQAMPLMP